MSSMKPSEPPPSRAYRETREQRRHVPAAAGADAELAVPRDQRPEAVPLQLKRVIACRKPAASSQHRLWQPQSHERSLRHGPGTSSLRGRRTWCRRTSIAKTKATGTRQPNAIPEKTARPLAPRPESGSLLSNT
jgi:hypothetical protein